MGAGELLTSLISAISPDEINIASNIDVTTGDDIDVSDVQDTSLNVKSGQNGDKIVIQEDHLIIYPNELQGEEYVLFERLTRTIKQDEGAVRRLPEQQQTEALEATNKSAIDETIRFFEDMLSDHYISLLRSCLYLRQIAEEESSYPGFNVDEEKRELKDRYGYEAYYFAHLVSSGYFDQERYFRELHSILENRSGITRVQYQDEFEQIVGEKLIAVFVSQEDTAYDVKHDVRAAVYKQARFGTTLNFIDICGFGRQCRETIEEVIDILEDEYPSIDYEQMDRNGEYVCRIFPATMKLSLE
jgi:hypothetical protein